MFDFARPDARRHHDLHARIRMYANRQPAGTTTDPDARCNAEGTAPIFTTTLAAQEFQLKMGAVPITEFVRRVFLHNLAASNVASRIALSASSSAASSAPPITCGDLPEPASSVASWFTDSCPAQMMT